MLLQAIVHKLEFWVNKMSALDLQTEAKVSSSRTNLALNAALIATKF